jgi:hypothetical protein
LMITLYQGNCSADTTKRCPPRSVLRPSSACWRGLLLSFLQRLQARWRLAVCRAEAGGFTIVAAAGNAARYFDDARQPEAPAAYPQVLTVTAMSDSDGRGGAAGGSSPCSAGEADDRAAGYSNFAARCAASRWPGPRRPGGAHARPPTPAPPAAPAGPPRRRCGWSPGGRRRR